MGLLMRIETSQASQKELAPYPAYARASANHLKRLCAALFALLALATSYWSVVQADALVNRNDNPRRITR
jgi:hypothetical protein